MAELASKHIQWAILRKIKHHESSLFASIKRLETGLAHNFWRFRLVLSVPSGWQLTIHVCCYSSSDSKALKGKKSRLWYSQFYFWSLVPLLPAHLCSKTPALWRILQLCPSCGLESIQQTWGSPLLMQQDIIIVIVTCPSLKRSSSTAHPPIKIDLR